MEGEGAPDTRQRLIVAAESLLAEHGLAVPLRMITEAAGQKNNAAVRYHFGDRQGLIEAVRERHVYEINDWRNEMLDALQREGRQHDVAALVQVAVTSLFRKLATPSGRDYLRISADLATRAGLAHMILPYERDLTALHRLDRLYRAALGNTRAVRERLDQLSHLLVVVASDRAKARCNHVQGLGSDDAFVDRLCASVTAFLCA